MRTERAHTIAGVGGRMFAAHPWTVGARTFSTQTWKARREYRDGGTLTRMTVTLRYDDQCRNGHNTFSATCWIEEVHRGHWRDAGCAHEAMARVFPELAPFFRWHLVSSDGPMHYPANAIYLAGERDCHGLLAGESRQIRNGRTGELCWIRKGPGTAYHDGPFCPPEVLNVGWEPLMRIGEGKARQLDAARSVAAWPEATDQELTSEDLPARLAERLPALLAAFKADMLALGFEWEAAP